MLKKYPPQNKDNLKNKIEIVEQQNQPFLKALQKRVRNINKKLAEITELQAKDNLKPEQVEKINRKTALIDQRTRLEENATLFKETYAQNIAVYRNVQLKELEILARALAIHHSGNKFEDQNKLTALWGILQNSDKTYPTLNQSITTLASALKDFANDKKLQKSLATFVELNGETKIQPIVPNQEKIVIQKQEEKTEVKPELPSAKEETLQIVPVAEPVVIQPTPVINKPEPKEAEKTIIKEQPKVIVQSQTTPIINQQVIPVETIKDQKESLEDDKKKKASPYNREDRPNNTRGGRRERKQGGQEPREKRQYKPRYQEKKPEEKNNGVKDQDSSSSHSSPQTRNFRHEQIKQLENEGFIVVGKPKPKAKDQQQLRQAHNKQHGNKTHHHHNK